MQSLARSVVGSNFELNQLTDRGIITALVEPFFRALPGTERRHMVDVGACFGRMAQPLVERGWTADLLEPDPECRAILLRNVSGRSTQCRVHAIAVSNSMAAEVSFHKSSTKGCSGLETSPFAPTASIITVPCTPLAKFYSDQGIRAVDFLQIDTEGFDFDVLESHDFGVLQPRLIMVDFDRRFARQTLDIVNAAIARMAERGYGAIVFSYTEEGAVKEGARARRLTEIFVDARIPELGRPAFGNILFYRQDDKDFLLAMFSLLNSCRRPAEVWRD